MKNNLLTDQLVYTGESQTPTHFHLCSYGATGFEETSETDFKNIVPKLVPGRINWLQIHGLRDTEMIQQICSYFQINFLTMQDILNIDHPSKIEEGDTYNVVISKISEIPRNEDDDIKQNHVCIVQGQEFVLTFMEEESSFFDDVKAAIKKNVLKVRERHTDFLLSVQLNSIMANYVSVVSHIDDALEDLETTLFANNTDARDVGRQIQMLRNQYMCMKQTVYPLKEEFTKILHSTDTTLIHKANRAVFNDVNDHLMYAIQSIDTCRETLSSLMDLYVSNNDLRMNDIMARLTMVSTIFIPLTFLVGVWGMNFKWMPELQWHYGYLFAWILMVLIAVGVYIYLRGKKWHN